MLGSCSGRFTRCLIYPQWRLEAGSVLPWLFPLGSVAVLLSAWLLRGRLGRGPVAALFYFAGTLLPVLGLINFYWMRFSFVGDHLVYLSSAGLLALGATLVVRGAERLRQPLLLRGFALLVLPLLAVLTWREAGQYRNAETLWRTTITRNPACWLAHNNLGVASGQRGQMDEELDPLPEMPWKSNRISPRRTTTSAPPFFRRDKRTRLSVISRRSWKSIRTSPRPTTTSATPIFKRDEWTKPLSISRKPW